MLHSEVRNSIKINVETALFIMLHDDSMAKMMKKAYHLDARATFYENRGEDEMADIYKRKAAQQLLNARNHAKNEWHVTDMVQGFINVKSPESCADASEAVRLMLDDVLYVEQRLHPAHPHKNRLHLHRLDRGRRRDAAHKIPAYYPGFCWGQGLYRPLGTHKLHDNL